MSEEIDINRRHICNEGCANIWLMGFMNAGPNPKWNPETKKCSDEGQIESKAPSICGYLNDKETFNLADEDDIVIPHQTTTIVLNYPLKKEFKFEFKADHKDGFTRKHIIGSICQKYQDIYNEEEVSTKMEVLSMEDRVKKGGLMNRNKTDGVYGIWGHDIGDLYLEGISYNHSTNEVTLSIGS